MNKWKIHGFFMKLTHFFPKLLLNLPPLNYILCYSTRSTDSLGSTMRIYGTQAQ